MSNDNPNEDPRHIEEVATWFDTRAKEWSDLYDDVRRVNDIVLIDRKDISVAFLRRELDPGARILDVGCGAGVTARDLVHAGFLVHGVDISQNMVDRSERRLAESGAPRDSYLFTRADLLEASLAAESFDGVVALGFIQYQTDEQRALEMVHRVLRPGGTLVISGPTKRQLANYFGAVAAAGAVLRRLGVLERTRPAAATAQHRYSVGRFTNLLRGAGFEVTSHRGHGYGDFLFVGRAIGFRGEVRLHRLLSRASGRLPLGRFANDLIMVARKR